MTTVVCFEGILCVFLITDVYIPKSLHETGLSGGVILHCAVCANRFLACLNHP
jgi:hypothetical protein